MSEQIDLLEGLNSEQRAAVEATEGYVRVIAGAGSGKTKTLAHRFAYIVNEVGISPSNILCVTFTNKAAQEMKARVRKLVDMGSVNDLICTYHGFCVKVLREDIHRLGYPQHFIIADKEDEKAALKEVFEELNLKSERATFKKVSEAIHQWKASPIAPNYIDNYINTYDTEKQGAFISFGETLPIPQNSYWQCYVKYLDKQKKGFVLDFDDLIHFTLHIFDRFPEVLEKWQERLDYIMVDETQDNSYVQWQMVKLLQQMHKNLFVVGDPDQCIYEWRGAKPESLTSFDSEFKPCRTIVLDRNYRSTQNILGVANSVIANNENRIPKELYTTKLSTHDVVHFHGKNEQEEGSFIAKTIIKQLDKGRRLSDVAILFRATYVSRYIEQALIKHKLPYVVYGGVRFFERREIKDVLSYLRMLDRADDLSFKRVINLPSRKLGKVFLTALQEVATAEKTTLYNALLRHINEAPFNKKGAKEFVELIEGIKLDMVGKSISDITQMVLVSSGIEEIYRTEGDEERLDNIKELIASIALYEENNANEENLSLTSYLQDIALYTNLDYQKESDAVKIMTIHQAKGLEFPVVFVAGMSEGIFPSERTIRERKRNGLEEERRLAYVAFTRAEEGLYITESEGYNFEMKSNKYPSRFIFEIKRNLLVRQGELSRELEESAKSYISRSERGLTTGEECDTLTAGAVVLHKLFGKGKVLRINDKEETLVVQFDNGPTKHFALERATSVLTIVE